MSLMCIAIEYVFALFLLWVNEWKILLLFFISISCVFYIELHISNEEKKIVNFNEMRTKRVRKRECVCECECEWLCVPVCISLCESERVRVKKKWDKYENRNGI